MIINGKERGFRYNVWASGKIAKLTATGEIRKIMNTAFEKHKQLRANARGEDYATDILDIADINDLTLKESTDLLEEIFRTMRKDSTGEIETEPVKTEKKTSPAGEVTESR